jgi:hypothetical protein
MSKKLSKTEQIEAHELFAAGRRISDIAKKFNVPVAEVKAAISEHKLLLDQNQKLQAELHRERDKTGLLIDVLQTAMEKYKVAPVKVPKAEKSYKTKEAQDFFALFSDAQIGELVEPEAVQGLSGFNFEIFKKRLDNWVKAILRFRNQDKNALGLNKLVLKFLGDNVEGEMIYRGQAFYIDINLFDQVFQGSVKVAEAVRTLASVFPEVECYGICGNHGRPGRKGEHHAKTNFDRFFYAFLSLALKDQPNVKFYTSDGPFMIVRHHQHHVAMIHGHEAKSWMGIPYYGLDRVEQRLKGMFGGLKINLMLCGDKHDPAILHEAIIMNGSFVGGSNFSINTLLLNSVPSQRIFYLDPKWGAHRHTSLWLDDAPKIEEDENRIFTPYTEFGREVKP